MENQKTLKLKPTSSTTTTSTETAPVAPTLTLTLSPQQSEETQPRVRFANETINNEHMNRKKSKVCCIYSKPHDPFKQEESSSEDECDVNAYERKPRHNH